MAKLIRQHDWTVTPSAASTSRPTDGASADSQRTAAFYEMAPEVSGNVNFVLFLSGNSTYRVDVTSYEE